MLYKSFFIQELHISEGAYEGDSEGSEYYFYPEKLIDKLYELKENKEIKLVNYSCSLHFHYNYNNSYETNENLSIGYSEGKFTRKIEIIENKLYLSMLGIPKENITNELADNSEKSWRDFMIKRLSDKNRCRMGY